MSPLTGAENSLAIRGAEAKSFLTLVKTRPGGEHWSPPLSRSRFPNVNNKYRKPITTFATDVTPLQPW